MRKPGQPLGTRREIKNQQLFRFMQQAIDYEIRWQIEQIEDGHAIQQATVLFDPDSGETRAMRTKEDAADYRYFPDPDLLPLVIGNDWRNSVKARCPNCRAPWPSVSWPNTACPIRRHHAHAAPAMAAYFEDTAEACGQPKLASNWVMGEISRRLNNEEIGMDAVKVSSAQLAALIGRIDGTISNNAAKQVFEALWTGEGRRCRHRRQGPCKQMNDTGALEKNHRRGLPPIWERGAVQGRQRQGI